MLLVVLQNAKLHVGKNDVSIRSYFFLASQHIRQLHGSIHIYSIGDDSYPNLNSLSLSLSLSLSSLFIHRVFISCAYSLFPTLFYKTDSSMNNVEVRNIACNKKCKKTFISLDCNRSNTR